MTTGVPNAAIFTINKEDHTIANVLRDKLLRSHSTLFAAYKVEHPLVPQVILRVQTDGSITPREAVSKACRDLITDLDKVKQEFTKEWELKKIARMAEGEEDEQTNGLNGYGAAPNGYGAVPNGYGGQQQGGYQPPAPQQSGYQYGYGASGANGGY